MESGFGSSINEGVFLLGTGSSGVCESMVAMGGGVFMLMQAAFWGYRLPVGRVYQPPHAPDQAKTAATTEADGAATPLPDKQETSPAAAPPAAPADVTLQGAMQSPNIYLLFAGSVGDGSGVPSGETFKRSGSVTVLLAMRVARSDLSAAKAVAKVASSTEAASSVACRE